jgi:hypothetical protein
MQRVDEGKGVAAGASRFGFDSFEHRTISTFAAQIILHFIMVARIVER